jgi:uncharacterized membrane protein
MIGTMTMMMMGRRSVMMAMMMMMMMHAPSARHFDIPIIQEVSETKDDGDYDDEE